MSSQKIAPTTKRHRPIELTSRQINDKPSHHANSVLLTNARPLLALVCTLSLAIASLGWFPAQSLAQENQSLAQENQTGSNRSGELQQMADDLAFQLNLLGQFDRPAFQARALELEKALQAWNDATRTDADFYGDGSLGCVRRFALRCLVGLDRGGNWT